MNAHDIKQFTRGWLIGDFEPSLFKRTDIEVAIQHYKKGDAPASHTHRRFTEWTLIVNGCVYRERHGFFDAGQIIEIPAGEASGYWRFVEDTTTLVIRDGSDPKDKHYD